MTTPLTARSPEDLLALAPMVLGFVPSESVVMLTFGASRPFHARVDLPPPQAAAEVLEALRGPAVHHGVERAVLVLYAVSAHPAETVGRVVRSGLEDAGIHVVDMIRADGRRWFPLLSHGAGHRRGRADGVPYDVSNHPFVAQGVLDGRVTLGSRAALADTLAPDLDAVARLAALVRQRPVDPADAVWVQATVRRLAGARTPPTDTEALRLLSAVATDVHCRDAAWAGVRRAEAPDHVGLWTGLLRCAPDDLAAAAAAVLALVAWLAGHGALAWCAVDRAQTLQPGHSLARLVADLLGGAVSPSEWDEAMDRSGPHDLPA